MKRSIRVRTKAPAYTKASSDRQAQSPKAQVLRPKAQVEEKFRVFLEQCPPRRFSRNLRTMLLEFLMTSGTEAPYIKDLLLDLESLFALLDAMEETSHVTAEATPRCDS